MSSKNKPVGQVAFVGTGPGDPGLLTVRATEVLAGAEAVVLDRGISDEQRDELVARWCPRGVEVLDAGFGENGQPLTHAGRAKVITRAAKAGQRVVRRAQEWVLRAVEVSRDLDPDDLGAIAPGLEIAQMRHERQRARMFMS